MSETELTQYYATPSCDGHLGNVTAGKAYKATILRSGVYGRSFNIIDDEGDELLCLERKCEFLRHGRTFGTWTLSTEAEQAPSTRTEE